MLCMAVTDADIGNCFDVINELRQHLVTALAHRSKGYGEKMIAWLRHQALQAGCDFFAFGFWHP